MPPSSGSITFNGNDITFEKPAETARRGIVRSFQISAVFPHMTVLENVRAALQRNEGNSFHFWKPESTLFHLHDRAQQLLQEVDLQDFAGELTVNLPYGRKRALELATTLALEPELMLLDEPTQGMGHEDVDRVTKLIKKVSKGRTILMVEHNMNVVSSIADRFKVQTAVRAEQYSDFGNTTTGKLAASFKASDQVLLRGSASSGFRAPSLQQVYFSSTFTDFISGQPQDVVLAPNGGTIANAAGLPKLKEENSKNFTLGLTLKPSNTTSVTADVYQIDITDRIGLSGRFDADNFPALGATLAALGVGQAQFFVNSIDTKTKGLDVTVSNKADLGSAKLNTFLALNLSQTDVVGVHAPTALKGYESVLLSERERLFIEQGGPRTKATLGFDYSQGAWETNFKIIHFGSQTLGTFSGTENGVPNAFYEPKTSADLAFTYSIDKNTKITFGGNNILNVKPTTQDANETDNGFIYDSVQFGLNGASYFAKFWKRF